MERRARSRWIGGPTVLGAALGSALLLLSASFSATSSAAVSQFLKLADFAAAGTGGDATYVGRDMVEAHKHMQMTQADFLSAGGDVIQAMKNKGYGQNEIDEFVCILVSMKDMVIYK